MLQEDLPSVPFSNTFTDVLNSVQLRGITVSNMLKYQSWSVHNLIVSALTWRGRLYPWLAGWVSRARRAACACSPPSPWGRPGRRSACSAAQCCPSQEGCQTFPESIMLVIYYKFAQCMNNIYIYLYSLLRRKSVKAKIHNWPNKSHISDYKDFAEYFFVYSFLYLQS